MVEAGYPVGGWDGHVIDVHRTGLGVVVTVRGPDVGETRIWWDPDKGLYGPESRRLERVHATAVDAAVRDCLEAANGPGMALERLNGSPMPAEGKTGAEGGAVISVTRIVEPGVAEVTVRSGGMGPVRFYWRYLHRPSSIIAEVGNLYPGSRDAVRAQLPALQRAIDEMDTPGRDLVIIPPGTEDHPLDHVEVSAEVPGWYGLSLSADSDAPNLFYGRAKIGKSLAIAALCDAWVERRPMVLAAEGDRVWRKRLRDLYPFARHPLLVGQYRSLPGQLAKIARNADHYEIEVVVVDVMRPVLSRLKANENDSHAIDMLLDSLRPLTEGRIVILVHHEGKDDGRGPRGTSALEDAAGAVFHVVADPDGGLVTVQPRSWRNGPLDDQPTLSVRFDQQGLLEVVPVDGRSHQPHPDRDSKILEAMNELDTPATIREIQELTPRLKGGKVTIADLQRLAAAGKIHSHPGYRGRVKWTLGTPRGCCEGSESS